jgi:CheY-like chemotaxis protein
MPNINGFEFLKDIRGVLSFIHVPVIIVSGNTGREFFDAARNTDCFAVLTKPVAPADLIGKIEKALDSVEKV